jgi:hypothetical protein
MAHSTHRLKAYMGDYKRPLVFCSLCGKEEDEGLNDSCALTFYQKTVDTPKREFYSGLPLNS